MPFNGTGTFTRIYNFVTDAANGVLVRADRMDTEMDGLATGLSNCITRDGQGGAAANIPFNTYKITGLGVGAASTDSVNYGQVFSSPTFSSPTFTGTVTGSGATTFTVPTVAAGDNSTNAASTAFATALAFAAALPAQTGNSGKYVTTNGTTASWALPIADQSGNSGKVLGTNGTTTAWESGGLKLLATLTPTAAANVDFLSTFSSTYDSYLIECIGLKPASNTTLALRVAIAGAASSANTYFYTTVNTTASTAATYAELCNGTNVLAAGIGINTSIIIRNANSLSGIKTISNRGEFQDAATPTYVVNASSAVFTTAGVLTGFRLFWSGGANFAAVGTVRVYGIANS